MQVGSDEGQDGIEQGGLDKNADCDEARPRRSEHTSVFGDQSAFALGAGAGGPRCRIEDELRDQRQCCGRKDAAENEEHVAPAEHVAEDAARDLSEQEPGNLAGEIAAEHGLPLLVGDDVADIGHGERDDAAGGQSANEPIGHEFGERECKAAQDGGRGGDKAQACDRIILSEPVADLAAKELDRAVRQPICSHHDRGGANGHGEVGRNLRQDRVRDPHHGLAGESREREQKDRTGRDR